MRHRWAATLATVLLLAAACGTEPADEPRAEDGTQDAEDAAPDDGAEPAEGNGDDPDEAAAEEDTDLLALDASCRTDELGFSIEHPDPWHVNDGEQLPVCTVFDPEPVEIPADRDLPTDLAIVLREEPVAFDELGARDEPGVEERSVEPATVDERDARVVELESTGAGLHPAGLVTYRYEVDRGAQTLVAETHDVEGAEPAYEERRDLLDAMMDSLEFHAPA